MTAIDLLCEIIAQGTPVAAAHYAQRSDLELLLELGWMKRVGTVQSVTCLHCDAMHDAEIVHSDGQDGFFCPDLGFVPVSPDEIAAIRPNVRLIVGLLADAISCRSRKSTAVAGETWRIGRVGTDAGDIALYLHPVLQSERDAANLRVALNSESGANFRLVLSAAGTLPIPGCHTALLRDTVELDMSRQKVEIVCDLGDLVGAPNKNRGGAPNRFGEQVSALIRARIAAGITVESRNGEARAVLADFKQKYPNSKAPSESLVKTYVTKIRAGQ